MEINFSLFIVFPLTKSFLKKYIIFIKLLVFLRKNMLWPVTPKVKAQFDVNLIKNQIYKNQHT